MSILAVSIDYTFFEKVCYVVCTTFEQWREIPVDKLRCALRHIADENTEDKETPFPECWPENAPFGGCYYPHEVFLHSVDLADPSFWDSLPDKHEQKQLPQRVIDFAGLVLQRL